MRPIRRFAQLMRGQYGRYAVLVVAWVMLRIGTLAVGLLLQRIFNTISGQASGGVDLWSLLALLGGVEAARQVLQFNVVVTRLEPKVLHQARSLLRDRLVMAHLHGDTSPEAADRQLVTIVSDDVDEVGNFAVLSPVHIARWIFAGLAVAILMSVDVVVATGVLVLLAALAMVTRLLYGRFIRYRARSMRAAAEARAVLREALAAVETVQATGAEQQALAHVHRVDQVRRRSMITERMYAELQRTTVANAVPLGTGLVLLAAAQGLRNDTLTVGDVALFGYYLQMLTEALASLGLLVVQLQRLAIALTRIFRFSPSIFESPPTTGPGGESVDRGGVRADERIPLRALEVDALRSAEADGAGESGVSFTAYRGSLTVIVGQVGAGKSAFLRALLGLTPTKGTVYWNGMALADRRGFLVPPRCAYVPQAPYLFSGTIRENVELGSRYPDEVFQEALRQAMLEADLAAMPAGPETIIGRQGLRLSGGQLQRVAIARALIRSPEVLLLDDVSSALDAETARGLWHELRRADTTIVAVSHDPELLVAADTVVTLRDGVAVGRGRLVDLLTENVEMRLLWRTYLDTCHDTPSAPSS